MKSLSERWSDYLVSWNPSSHLTPEEFEQYLKRLSTVSGRQVYMYLKEHPGEDLDEGDLILNVLENGGLFDPGHNLSEVGKYYSKLHDRVTSLQDTRRQYDWAHFWENARLFMFRILTAIGIAAGHLLRRAQVWHPVATENPYINS